MILLSAFCWGNCVCVCVCVCVRVYTHRWFNGERGQGYKHRGMYLFDTYERCACVREGERERDRIMCTGVCVSYGCVADDASRWEMASQLVCVCRPLSGMCYASRFKEPSKNTLLLSPFSYVLCVRARAFENHSVWTQTHNCLWDSDKTYSTNSHTHGHKNLNGYIYIYSYMDKSW